MWSFLSALFHYRDGDCTVIVMDEASTERPRRYRVRPARLFLGWGASLLGAAVVAALLMALTPLRVLVTGRDASEVAQRARMNALRVQALEDSLAMQDQYVGRLRNLMTGQVDSAFVAEATQAEAGETALSGELAKDVTEPRSDAWADHEQPTLALSQLPAAAPPVRMAAADAASLSSPQFPVLPPVEGFLTRGFDARAGHYAVDIAATEGTPVRSLGDGYVILADWTQDGGHALAVQHAGGYVSVYKHNRRLLKRAGDRVRAREVIAQSGNSGEVTTGPHVHVELWRNGLAQDPRQYFVEP